MENAIVIPGDPSEVKGAMYFIMLNKSFIPSKLAILTSDGLVNNLKLDVLSKFKGIFFTTGSIDESSRPLLIDYIKNGGVLLPNVFEGQQNVDLEEFFNWIGSFNESYDTVTEINISYYSPNKVEIKINGEEGFLILSEKFYLMEGWKAHVNGKQKEIFRANGISSAVLLDGETGTLTFEYKPKSFRNGALITGLTILLIAAYFIGRKRFIKNTIVKQAGKNNTNITILGDQNQNKDQ